MDRPEIMRLLGELGQDLLDRGIRADLYVVGGAAIALAYDDRRSTRDIEFFVRAVLDEEPQS
ncbi:MAG TPA: nucleotidyltransferase [Mycobacteriales bacterium]